MSRKKIWKSSLSSSAGMSVSEDAATIQSSKSNFIVLTSDGTYHGGKHSFICAPSDIRIGGMWTLNDNILSTIPSTIVTPIPALSNSQPISGVANIATMVAELSSMLI